MLEPRDRLVILNGVELGCHARTVPRSTFIIRPFDGHAKEGMHVELHDPARPRVDVDVRIIGIGDG